MTQKQNRKFNFIEKFGNLMVGKDAHPTIFRCFTSRNDIRNYFVNLNLRFFASPCFAQNDEVVQCEKTNGDDFTVGKDTRPTMLQDCSKKK